MFEFIIIVESAADFRIASDIANRIFCEKIEWIEEHLDYIFKWSGLQEQTDFSCWSDINKIRREAESRGIRLPRFLRRDQPLKADGARALKTLQLVNQLRRTRDIQAVIFIRDLDNQPERRVGLEQSREEYEQQGQNLPVVIGTAKITREAWVLNGFSALDEAEESTLAELRKKLSFDPVTEAHRLREKTFQEPERIRNAKVVLGILTKEDHTRESYCWQITPLDTLRERGLQTGLTDYIAEVEDALVPILLQA